MAGFLMLPYAHWKLARSHAAASIAVLGKLMARINSLLVENDERICMITHESLCVDPVDVVIGICNHFNMMLSSALERFVIEHSGGGVERADAQDGRTHDFKRNSRAIPDAW